MGCSGSKHGKGINHSKSISLTTPGTFSGFTTKNRYVMSSMQRGRCPPKSGNIAN
jgi:hypothetical protein